jgi:hypothetical protein
MNPVEEIPARGGINNLSECVGLVYAGTLKCFPAAG